MWDAFSLLLHLLSCWLLFFSTETSTRRRREASPERETFRPFQHQGHALEQHIEAHPLKPWFQHPGGENYVSKSHCCACANGSERRCGRKPVSSLGPNKQFSNCTFLKNRKNSNDAQKDATLIHDVQMQAAPNIDNPAVAKIAGPPLRLGGLHDRKDGDLQSSVRSPL